MLFAMVCTDKPASLDLRAETRARHLEYVDAIRGCVVQAGALLDADARPCGSLFIIDVADADAAAGFAAADPYALAGLFESVSIRPFRQVFAGGERVG